MGVPGEFALYALLANSYTLLAQGFEYSRAPIDSPAFLMNIDDLMRQFLIRLDPIRRQSLAPVIVTAGRYIQPLAQMNYFVLVSVSLDELISL